MNMRWLALVAAVLLVASGQAYGVVYDISDNPTNHRWWGDPMGDTTWADTRGDAYGAPNFVSVTKGGISVQAGTGKLLGISLDYNVPHLATKLMPGDFFIDTTPDNTNTWDYVVRSPFADTKQAYTDSEVNNGTADWDVYYFASGISSLGIDSATQNALYKLADWKTNAQTAESWARRGNAWASESGVGDVRRGQPWALERSEFNSGTKVGTIDFLGWTDSATGNTTGWDFTSNSGGTLPTILLGDATRIGFTVNCANDLVWDEVSTPAAQIPEPTSLLIWGGASGLGLGALALRRRRHAKAARNRWTNESRQQIMAIIDRQTR